MPQPKTYSVSRVTEYIKNVFDSDYLLPKLTVSGEVWECKHHGSGHIYFTLKDEHAQLSCVMFAKNRMGLDFALKTGQQVDVSGNISVYKATGKYQLYADSILLSGHGDLFARFLALKERLAQTGMFDPVYKKPIPRYSKRLGVVTSLDGAALQDILRVSTRRNPGVEIIISPAAVQGAGAAQTIVKALLALKKQAVDVIIIGRGGGSAEDLWVFNDEAIAQAIFDCEIPVISAVGHETDFTIVDYVADLRAPTPSAAAEIAVFEQAAVKDTVSIYKNTLHNLIRQKMTNIVTQTERRRLLLEARNPLSRTLLIREKILRYKTNLDHDMNSSVNTAKYNLGRMAERFAGVSPLNTLNRGFSYVTDKNKKAVRAVCEVKTGDVLNVRLAKGELLATVDKVINE